MSFENPQAPSSEAPETKENREQSEREETRIALFCDHGIDRNPALTSEQRQTVKAYMLANTGKPWGQYDDQDVIYTLLEVKDKHLVIQFDVMGNAVTESIPL
jgi:hypothetical protein